MTNQELLIATIGIVVVVFIPYLIGTLISDYPADTVKEKIQTWATGIIVIIAFQYALTALDWLFTVLTGALV